jgi:2-polyprenyl-3-methyl-5-hydroxy-6-metoxy-1,4-benzoquinol methylase
MKLISDEYRKLNKELHLSPKKYGQRGHRHLGVVKSLRKKYKCKTVLDYGCGQGDLSRKAWFAVQNYDPAVDEYSQLPAPADLVVCTDVLEHIEPELLDNVLSHLQELAVKVGYFVIATRYDTSKTLPDGSNPHKIVRKAEWWQKKLSEYFESDLKHETKGECTILCTPLKQ